MYIYICVKIVCYFVKRLNTFFPFYYTEHFKYRRRCAIFLVRKEDRLKKSEIN